MFKIVKNCSYNVKFIKNFKSINNYNLYYYFNLNLMYVVINFIVVSILNVIEISF